MTRLDASPDHIKARDVCLRLLTVMPRPRAKLASELRRRDIPEDVAEQVLDRLVETGLLDDAEYARSYVRAKHRDRALGRDALRHELRRAGIDPEEIEQAVAGIGDGDERERARDWVERRAPAALAGGRESARRRLLGQLARRGYPAETAISVVDEVLDHLHE